MAKLTQRDTDNVRFVNREDMVDGKLYTYTYPAENVEGLICFRAGDHIVFIDNISNPGSSQFRCGTIESFRGPRYAVREMPTGFSFTLTQEGRS